MNEHSGYREPSIKTLSPSVKSSRTVAVGRILVFQFIYRICVVSGHLTVDVFPLALLIFCFISTKQPTFSSSALKLHSGYSQLLSVPLSLPPDLVETSGTCNHFSLVLGKRTDT